MYEKIKTARELVTHVRAHCMNTELENINRAADILGNSTESELASVANEDKDTFFLIAKFTWSMPQCIDFYIKHCSPSVDRLAQDKGEAEERAERAERAAATAKEAHTWEEAARKAEEERHKATKAQLAEARQEIEVLRRIIRADALRERGQNHAEA